MAGTDWHAHPGFAALYRWRGFLASACGLLGALWLWPPPRSGQAWQRLWSLLPLLAGLALRVWARRHIGLHTRGKWLEAPYRAIGGPYRHLSHPLYLANVLVALGCLGAIGGGVGATLLATLPVALLYVLLARGESAFLAAGNPPTQSTRVERPGWAKEFWSLVPPLVLWGVLRMLRGG